MATKVGVTLWPRKRAFVTHFLLYHTPAAGSLYPPSFKSSVGRAVQVMPLSYTGAPTLCSCHSTLEWVREGEIAGLWWMEPHLAQLAGDHVPSKACKAGRHPGVRAAFPKHRNRHARRPEIRAGRSRKAVARACSNNRARFKTMLAEAMQDIQIGQRHTWPKCGSCRFLAEGHSESPSKWRHPTTWRRTDRSPTKIPGRLSAGARDA